MLERIKNTTCFIRNKLGISATKYFEQQDGYIDCAINPPPAVGIVLGSGLGALADRIDVISTLEYSDIPDFPQSTVAGHHGRFIYGTLAGKRVVAMQGRIHYYEGYTMEDVVLPVRAMCSLGIDTLIVSNAAGGLSPLFDAGDIMVIDDQINLLPNPLIGPNIDMFGVRFPDMSEPFDRSLIALSHAVARDQGFALRQGCYVGHSGPTFETPAEYRYLRTIGADAAGMSTTPEVIVARHHGVRVLGFSLISNVGIPDRDRASDSGRSMVATHEEVMQAGTKVADRMSNLVDGILARM